VTIAVAMSGGVDSSVAAAILTREGHDIVGFTMQLWNQRRRAVASAEQVASRCCSLDDVYDARRVAEHIGFPFYVINLEDEFERMVVRPFVESYLEGRTPIPCVACNSRLKFARLASLANSVGAAYVATGHYARVERDARLGRFILRKGKDTAKDQSYFLFELTQKQLARAVFPLGEMSKSEVREIARDLGLSTADKPESQEICFVPDGNYSRFVENYAASEMDTPVAAKSGVVQSAEGVKLGEHHGLHRYTIGQRKGIGVSAEKPMYVVKIDVPRNSLVVGHREELYQKTMTVSEVNWIAINEPGEPLRANVRIRYRAPEAPAEITPIGGGIVRVDFDEAQLAITPGQAAVFYDNDKVVGGGWIQKSNN
jgi:tRNA-uridine 2-sulfurtransferase